MTTLDGTPRSTPHPAPPAGPISGLPIDPQTGRSYIDIFSGMYYLPIVKMTPIFPSFKITVF